MRAGNMQLPAFGSVGAVVIDDDGEAVLSIAALHALVGDPSRVRRRQSQLVVLGRPSQRRPKARPQPVSAGTSVRNRKLGVGHGGVTGTPGGVAPVRNP